ncbi:MAG: hypothetical protein M1820_009634 [Bogoriella megaspora]|nr:MAG: hypothetical protein M1820_009634 [Bogoriella megaspora]
MAAVLSARVILATPLTPIINEPEDHGPEVQTDDTKPETWVGWDKVGIDKSHNHPKFNVIKAGTPEYQKLKTSLQSPEKELDKTANQDYRCGILGEEKTIKSDVVSKAYHEMSALLKSKSAIPASDDSSSFPAPWVPSSLITRQGAMPPGIPELCRKAIDPLGTGGAHFYILPVLKDGTSDPIFQPHGHTGPYRFVAAHSDSDTKPCGMISFRNGKATGDPTWCTAGSDPDKL